MDFHNSVFTPNTVFGDLIAHLYCTFKANNTKLDTLQRSRKEPLWLKFMYLS